MATTNKTLVNYVTHTGKDLPPIRAALYEYVFSDWGVNLRARKPNLEVLFQIAPCRIKGLGQVSELFEWQRPRVPAEFLERILVEARQAALADLEKLFHLHYDGGWFLDVPEQEQGPASCRSLDDESRNRAEIELHSHHSMAAKFSSIDDRDERGFRIYAVIGRVLDEPEISVRVGVYGHFHDLPAEWVFEMPDGLKDANDDNTAEQFVEYLER